MCEPNFGGLRNTKFSDRVKQYNEKEDTLQSTQKLAETDYNRDTFWNQIGKFKLYR